MKEKKIILADLLDNNSPISIREILTSTMVKTGCSAAYYFPGTVRLFFCIAQQFIWFPVLQLHM